MQSARTSIELDGIDVAICCGFLLSVLLVGLFFTVKKRRRSAAKDNSKAMDDYFLGGHRLSWWALGIADASSYIDISGAMLGSALIYALGIQGMYVELRGGLCLFLAFQLSFTGKLSRRCPIKTRGEWIKFRFGDGPEAVVLRTAVAITSLLSGILAVTYFAVGGGKFFAEFVPMPAWCGLPPEFWSAALLVAVAMLYTIASGFTSVVFTDVYQSVFIFSSFAMVAWMGASVELPETFSVYLPSLQDQSERTAIKMNTTRSEWTSAMPSSSLHIPEDSSFAMYNSFGSIIGSYALLQGVRAASGPGRLGLQSVLATRSERDVRSQTLLAMVLLAFKWAFSAGIAVLAIQFSTQHDGIAIDLERVVPLVIGEVLPTGAKGFTLASLLAAALTSFDTTLNSAASYWTIDLYQGIINPNATPQRLLWHARASTVLVLAAGLLLSLHVTTINRIWGFITIALAGGMMWPFFLCWYWSRFNSRGCLAGIIAGASTAIAVFVYYPLLEELSALLVTSSVSAVVSCGVCLTTERTPERVVRRFYRAVRPPGVWTQVQRWCFTDASIRAINRENRADLLSTGLIASAQLTLYMLAASLAARAWTQSVALAGVLCIVSPLIYLLWYRRLDDRPAHLRDEIDVGLLEPRAIPHEV